CHLADTEIRLCLGAGATEQRSPAALWAGPGSLFPVIRGREDGSAQSTVTGRGDPWLDAVLPESRAADRARPTGPGRSRARPGAGAGRRALPGPAASAPTRSRCSTPRSQPEQDRRGGAPPARHSTAPTSTGSAARSTPNASRTPPATPRARASRPAVVAPPG